MENNTTLHSISDFALDHIKNYVRIMAWTPRELMRYSNSKCYDLKSASARSDMTIYSLKNVSGLVT